MVYLNWLGSNIFTVWLKYLGQCLKTICILVTERPEAIFVMSPPVFAVFAVFLYARCTRTPYIIDAHTAAFLHPRWKHWQPFQHFLARHAATTIVTNDYLATHVRSGGGHVTIVRDVPVVYRESEEFSVSDAFSVAVICSFNYDEPIDEIFKAASQLPDVQFYMTGDPKFLDQKLARNIPSNITLTGFLPDSSYGCLLKRSHVILTLTTRDHTMLRGAYESVYQGTPIIISDWKILKDTFEMGVIHVDNSSESIVHAVEEMRRNYKKYKNEVAIMRERRYEQWEKSKGKIVETVIENALS